MLLRVFWELRFEACCCAVWGSGKQGEDLRDVHKKKSYFGFVGARLEEVHTAVGFRGADSAFSNLLAVALKMEKKMASVWVEVQSSPVRRAESREVWTMSCRTQWDGGGLLLFVSLKPFDSVYICTYARQNNKKHEKSVHSATCNNVVNDYWSAVAIDLKVIDHSPASSVLV